MADQQEKTTHIISVFADNFQFYLQDQVDDCDYPEDWNDSLLTRLFACGEKVVGIGTVRDLDCEITLEVFANPMDEKQQQDEPDLSDYDHVAQCNIEIPSGKLMIGGCTTDYEETTKLDLAPGHYGVRIFWSNLDKTDTLGFEGDDQYMIQLFPETYFDEVIFKFWRQLALQLNTQNN
jgi:hypothetical protein